MGLVSTGQACPKEDGLREGIQRISVHTFETRKVPRNVGCFLQAKGGLFYVTKWLQPRLFILLVLVLKVTSKKCLFQSTCLSSTRHIVGSNDPTLPCEPLLLRRFLARPSNPIYTGLSCRCDQLEHEKHITVVVIRRKGYQL